MWALLEGTAANVEKVADSPIPLGTVTGWNASLDSLVVPGEELLAQCPTRPSQRPQGELPLDVCFRYGWRSKLEWQWECIITEANVLEVRKDVQKNFVCKFENCGVRQRHSRFEHSSHRLGAVWVTFGGLGFEITISSGILARLLFGSAELLEVRIPGLGGSGKRERRAERSLKRPSQAANSGTSPLRLDSSSVSSGQSSVGNSQPPTACTHGPSPHLRTASYSYHPPDTSWVGRVAG